MATINELAEAVTHELNTAALTMDFNAVKRFRPIIKRRDLDGLSVQVVPESKAQEDISRGSKRNAFNINIGIQKPLDNSASDDEAEIGELMIFAEAVADYMAGRELAQLPAASWISFDLDPIYDPEAIDESRIFRSVITLAYQVIE